MESSKHTTPEDFAAQTNSTSCELPRNPDGTLRVIYTSKEAEERGFPFKTPAPEPKTCRYCGKTLYHEGIWYAGVIYIWQKYPQRCDCPSAQEYWRRKDEKDRVKKLTEEEEAERKRRAERMQGLMDESGMKRRFMNRTFETYKTDTPEREKAYNVSRSYAENFDAAFKRGNGLYIMGGNGTGKTHLAAAIAIDLMRREIPVIFRNSVTLMQELRDKLDHPDESIHGFYRSLREADLLIIDDLGKERCTEWTMSELYGIVNDRYEDMRPTIITTNYSPDNLAAALIPSGGDRTKIDAVVSRLRESCAVIVLDGEDYRKEVHT